tara:strand:+ start:366 stop:1061 length:696 start_codon:yes stop_codon:yes gene_type:complete
MNFQFNYTFYEKIILKIKKKTEPILFKNFKNQPSILIRHDIDLDPEFAVEIAKIESRYKVKSTFFFQIGCHNYNLLNYNNKKILIYIKSLGHEIGLHFDVENYSRKDLRKKFVFEKKILETISNSQIRSVSLHAPSLNNLYPYFKGYINAYDKKLFNNRIYLSDSCMNFRGKNIFKIIENYNPKKDILQILLHPMHFSKKQETLKKIVDSHISRYKSKTYEIFKKNSAFKK